MWSAGQIKELIAEGREIQKRLEKTMKKKDESREKAMCRLVTLGKLRQAMKYIDHEDQTLGVHPLNETITNLLSQKHPKSQQVSEDILLPENAEDPLPVVFEGIDANSVYRAALHLVFQRQSKSGMLPY